MNLPNSEIDKSTGSCLEEIFLRDLLEHKNGCEDMTFIKDDAKVTPSGLYDLFLKWSNDPNDESKKNSKTRRMFCTTVIRIIGKTTTAVPSKVTVWPGHPQLSHSNTPMRVYTLSKAKMFNNSTIGHMEHKTPTTTKHPHTPHEHTISNKIAKQENGQREVGCRFGRIDVLTATEVIEVKRVNDYKGAIGQVLCYTREYPYHKPRIHLYGNGSLAQYHNAIVAIAGAGIRCTMEGAVVTMPGSF